MTNFQTCAREKYSLLITWVRKELWGMQSFLEDFQLILLLYSHIAPPIPRYVVPPILEHFWNLGYRLALFLLIFSLMKVLCYQLSKKPQSVNI